MGYINPLISPQSLSSFLSSSSSHHDEGEEERSAGCSPPAGQHQHQQRRRRHRCRRQHHHNHDYQPHLHLHTTTTTTTSPATTPRGHASSTFGCLLSGIEVGVEEGGRSTASSACRLHLRLEAERDASAVRADPALCPKPALGRLWQWYVDIPKHRPFVLVLQASLKASLPMLCRFHAILT